MNYTPHTEEEIKQMLEDLGVKSLDGLFSGIPDGLKPLVSIFLR